MPLRKAGYLHGNLEHHLDHLAPFCSLMGYPLIVTENEIFELGKRYYPDLDIRYCNPLEAPFEVTEHFDFIVTTLPRALFDDIFFIAEASLGKRLKTAWLPHGNSDKGNLEPLAAEEILLVYSSNFMIPSPSQTVIPIGNFRAIYFQRHRLFYQSLLNSMKLKNPITLYAPTWDDSSLENAADTLLQELSDFPLVIKPHPNQAQTPLAIQKKLSCDCWLDNFPPIYPLLERTSHFIGDFSSIGYDFLYFNRPMFFLKCPKTAALHECGKIVALLDLPKALLQPQNQLEAVRQKLYTDTFGEKTSWEAAHKQILEALDAL